MPVTRERSERSTARLTRRHLARLSTIAAEDRELFLATHPTFRGRGIAVVLAQGAATHYVTGTKGVKDVDVWTFFSLPPSYARFPADRRHRHVDFGLSVFGRQLYDFGKARHEPERRRWQRWHDQHEGRRVDLMMRGLKVTPNADPAEAIRTWLAGTAGSPRALRKGAVVLIDPPDRRGEVVWRPEWA
jgi:GNAT superfamily N-acetyltransferase